MNKKNICAPGNSYDYTCFNMNSLKKIAGKLNKDSRFESYKDINTKKYNKKNKKKFVKEIQKKLNCKKHLDFCVIEKKAEFYNEIKNTLKPKAPNGKYEWLSTLDIRDVMEQYEKKYKDFNFIGPYPMDFEMIYEELANLNLKQLCKKEKKIGIVFNTDISTGPGEHWISMFLDLKNRTLCFFDSVGDKPPMPVWRLMKKIEKQSKQMKCPIKIVVNKKQFQYKDSECGVYSLWFLISRLRGKSCDFLFKNPISDAKMNKNRKKFFRK